VTRLVHYHPRALAGDGGVTLAMRRWAAGQAAAGIDVVVATDEGPAQLEVPHVVVSHRGRGQLRRPLDLDLAGADALVLHSAWVGYNIRAAAAARAAGVPYVLTPHGGYHPQVVARNRLAKRAWLRLFECGLIREARAVHVFFEDERAGIEALGYRGPLIVTPNPVEVPPGRHWDGGSGGYLLWLGRYDVHGKGLDLLLRALALLPESERPELRLHGSGAGRRETERLRADAGLERFVSVGDPVHGDAKWDLLERAAGFVYPSRFEAFGLAPAEAVAIGVPTLVTPYPLGRFLAARGAAVLAACVPEELAAGVRRLEPPRDTVVQTEFARERVTRSFLDQLSGVL